MNRSDLDTITTALDRQIDYAYDRGDDKTAQAYREATKALASGAIGTEGLRDARDAVAEQSGHETRLAISARRRGDDEQAEQHEAMRELLGDALDALDRAIGE